MIQISVDTRRAVVTNKETLTVGSAGIQVEFTLSEDWNALSKLAVFRVGDDGTKVDVVLDESLICVVPPEVLKDEDEVLFIGIYGANEQGTIIIPTIWASAGVVKPGTVPNTPANAQPTPEIWAQILGVAQDAEQTAGDAMSKVEAGLASLTELEEGVEDAETVRAANELTRISNEESREAAETARATAETGRANSETSRATAEAGRVTAEAARVTAENGRVSAESGRVSAEEARVAAEENRESHYAEYVTTVQGYANAASASATSAAGSATDAASSASSASTSAGQAASSASSASTSASQASSSASSASTSATTASNAATTATTKAGEAASSATAASGSATAAEAAQTAAETAAALMQPAATSADVGKALIAKTVSGGKVTEYEYGDVGGSDAGDIAFDPEEDYDEGTVGAELSDQSNAIEQKQTAPSSAGTAGQVLGLDSNLNPAWVDQTGGGGGMNIVNLSGTQITQVGADNTMYMCGELTELTFTAPAVGITGIRFTSGTTPTVLTISGVTAWMFDFDPTSLEASTTYEINVLNGVGCAGWA